MVKRQQTHPGVGLMWVLGTAGTVGQAVGWVIFTSTLSRVMAAHLLSPLLRTGAGLSSQDMWLLLGGGLIAVLGLWLILMTAGDLARYKGQSRTGWTIGTFVFGPLALLLLAVLPKQPSAAPTGSLSAELGHLAGLHAAGTISDDEFLRAKQRLLMP